MNKFQNESNLGHFIKYTRRYIRSIEELYAVLYAFYKSKDTYHSIPAFHKALETIEPFTDVYNFVKRFGECGFCEESQNLYIVFDKEDYADMILSISDSASSYGIYRRSRTPFDMTPGSIIDLAISILGICENDKVADLCTGTGKFILKAKEKVSNAKYAGYDINPNAMALASIIKEVSGEDYTIEQRNIFELDDNEHFDKVFSHYPFGMRKSSLEESFYFQLRKKGIPVSDFGNADWPFNYAALERLNGSGKAVVIMSMGAAINNSDRLIREYFVTRGFVESVIALPHGIFPHTNISCILLIMSFNNRSVRMVDATKYGEYEKMLNILSEDDINSIIRDLSEDGENSKSMLPEELRENNFSLDPRKYFVKRPEYDESVALEDVITRIVRGVHFNQAELEILQANDKTNYKYLQLNNISDGVVEEDSLLYLKEIPERCMRYTAKAGDIVLSKNLPTKVAVIEDEKTQILISGNLFILRVDQNKINPYYIKAFLESREGENALSAISKGTKITILPINDLKSIRIPILNKNREEMIIQECKLSISEIKLLKRRLNQIKESIYNFYEGV